MRNWILKKIKACLLQMRKMFTWETQLTIIKNRISRMMIKMLEELKYSTSNIGHRKS
jgi:hypothetical protein